MSTKNIPYIDDEIISGMAKTCEKYYKALERAKYALTTDMDNSGHWAVNYIFPELKEDNNDEKIRKALIEMIHDTTGDECEDCYHVSKESVLAWLEKQGNKIVDCQQNHQDVKYPNGGIVMEDFNGGEGFYKLQLDYLNKKQVEEVEEMVRTWNKESKTLNADDVIDWLKTKVYDDSTYGMAMIDKFKKDFEL